MAPETKPDRGEEKRGISRRGFLTSVGAGIATVAAGPRLEARSPAEIGAEPESLLRATLSINGRRRTFLVEPRHTLLGVLRGSGLTAVKPGCERGECGACSVLVDGLARYSCLTLAVEAEGSEITTPEGLMEGEELGAVQRAFVEEDGFQCGFCTPGQTVAVEALLRRNPTPSLEEIRLGVSGNLCRCGAYRNIFRAARRAAEFKRRPEG